MSLWTPSGEHPVADDRTTRATGGRARGAPPGAAGSGGEPGTPGREGDAPEDGATTTVDELRQQLSDTPADVVVANHCYGLFELAAVYLSASPPQLDQARLAIDALGSLVEGLGERLGEPHRSLRDALAQIRLAYVQIAAADEGAAPGGDPGSGAAPARGNSTGSGAGS